MANASSGFRQVGIILALGVTLLAGKELYERRAGNQSPRYEPPPPRVTRKTDPDPGPPEQPDEIGVRSLVGELVDLERLTRVAEPSFRTYLASSYDRRSKTPSDQENWFANEDWASRERPNYVRVENVGGRREYVLMDVDGPGALVRLWSASPTGILRIYLDGSAEPVIEERTVDLLSGSGTLPSPFAYVAARGYSAYFPIPFRQKCKVTVDELVAKDPFGGGPLERFYYQINYRVYPGHVASRIRPFRHSDLQRMADEISRVAAVLADGSRANQPSTAAKVVPLLRSGNQLRCEVDSKSGGVIRQLIVRARQLDEAALRRATITMAFDGRRSVMAPLGDFFGTGPGLSPYVSIPFTVGADGTMTSRWPMPFQHRAELTITDAGELEGELWVEPYQWSESSLYFHAQWQPGATMRSHPPRDLNLAEIGASGAYVGTLFNITNAAGARWWGEGDEKIYVDGELFPSHFGTGTEDYFGYAWSSPETYTRPLHAQTRADGPGFDGKFSVNRFHTLDRIPFSRALRFDLELWHWDDCDISWNALAYYYARPSVDVPPIGRDAGHAGATARFEPQR